MGKLIVLIGESASGKTTIESALAETELYEKAISDTTRPKRSGEVDGQDYNFVSDDEFLSGLENDLYAEHTEYNGWFYGIRDSELRSKDKHIVVVLNPHGFRQIKEIKDLDILSFHISVDWRTRAKRLINRGDDMMEIFRRIISDTDVFQGIDKEVDFVIDNSDGKKLVEVVYSIMAKISSQK